MTAADLDLARAVSDAAFVLGRVEGSLETVVMYEMPEHAREAIRKTLAGYKAEAEAVIWAAIYTAMEHPALFRWRLDEQSRLRAQPRPGFVDV